MIHMKVRISWVADLKTFLLGLTPNSGLHGCMMTRQFKHWRNVRQVEFCLAMSDEIQSPASKASRSPSGCAYTIHAYGNPHVIGKVTGSIATAFVWAGWPCASGLGSGRHLQCVAWGPHERPACWARHRLRVILTELQAQRCSTWQRSGAAIMLSLFRRQSSSHEGMDLDLGRPLWQLMTRSTGDQEP